MPNWCENELTVIGNKQDLDRFVKLAATNKCPLDFNNFILYPAAWKRADELHEKWHTEFMELSPEARVKYEKDNPEPEDGYNHGGYEWCKKNWGTKWRPSEVRVQRSSDEVLHLDFDTAWSPPNPIVKKMAELFPTLEFHLEYREPSMCFHGVLDMKKGVVTNDVCGAYVPDIDEEG